MRFVIIADSYAGTGVALQARELDAAVHIAVTLADALRIAVSATALFHGMEAEAVNNLDLRYMPPFNSPWNPVQMAAQAWSPGTA